jgi:hypothetical protein
MTLSQLKSELSHYKSKCVDLMCENDELKQALSQRNQEILEIIDEFRTQCYGKLNGLDSNLDWWLCIDELITEYLKKQLPTTEEGKE